MSVEFVEKQQEFGTDMHMGEEGGKNPKNIILLSLPEIEITEFSRLPMNPIQTLIADLINTMYNLSDKISSFTFTGQRSMNPYFKHKWEHISIRSNRISPFLFSKTH